jgi:hypothetical protein
MRKLGCHCVFFNSKFFSNLPKIVPSGLILFPDERKNRSTTICCGSFLSTRFEREGDTEPVMSSELHRNQVTDAQTTHENLRDAAYHEAGHVVVAQFLGLTVREVEIEEDGSGRADIRHAAHLPLVDQIALCVAGIEAQELFNCPLHQHAALGDYLKVRKLARKFITWHNLKCEHGNGSWCLHDNIVFVKTCNGSKATQLGGHSPEGIARLLWREHSSVRSRL